MTQYKYLPKGKYRNPRPRMPTFSYVGGYSYHIIIGTFGDQPIFTDDWNYQGFVQIPKEVAGKHGFIVVIYCFMPNHLHLLLESGENGDLKEMTRIFKQRTAYHYKQATGNKLWQSSYLDRVLRKEEDILIVARYIAENPVKAKLVNSAIDYPFTDSFKYSKEEICVW